MFLLPITLIKCSIFRKNEPAREKNHLIRGPKVKKLFYKLTDAILPLAGSLYKK